jgi:hypothetical protein
MVGDGEVLASGVDVPESLMCRDISRAELMWCGVRKKVVRRPILVRQASGNIRESVKEKEIRLRCLRTEKKDGALRT